MKHTHNKEYIAMGETEVTDPAKRLPHAKTASYYVCLRMGRKRERIRLPPSVI